MEGRIINSVADDDKYNFHQGCLLYHKFQDSPTKWTYTNRDRSIDLRPILPQIIEQFEMMADLKLTEEEAEYMLKDENCFCTEEYLEYLTKTPVFNPSEIKIQEYNGGFFSLGYEIPEAGRSTLVEVKTLSMISELHFRNTYVEYYDDVLKSGEAWVRHQVDWLKKYAHPSLRILEMGGRRRFSYEHHERALLSFWNNTPEFFKGTSNVHLGMKHNIPSYGTMAHLMFMFMQTIYSLPESQKKTLEMWHDFFKGKLPVALTDTLGDEKWDRDFDKDLSEKFPIERNDSGNPYLWGAERINSAKEKGLDPLKRGLLFSNNLDLEKANNITNSFHDKINVEIGMGTFLSNSMGFPEHKPIPHVCKMTWANGLPTCKLSADIDKFQCEDNDFAVWAKKVAKRF